MKKLLASAAVAAALVCVLAFAAPVAAQVAVTSVQSSDDVLATYLAGFDLGALAEEHAGRTGLPAFAAVGRVVRVDPNPSAKPDGNWAALGEAPGQGIYFRDVTLEGGFTFRCFRSMGAVEWSPLECGDLRPGAITLLVGMSGVVFFVPEGLSATSDEWIAGLYPANHLLVLGSSEEGATTSVAFAEPPPPEDKRSILEE